MRGTGTRLPRMGLAAIGLWAGCSGGGRPLAVTPAALVDGSDVEGFDVAGQVGPALVGAAPFTVPVRAINAFGASVPSDPTDRFEVDGIGRAVAFDGFGYGGITVDDPGVAEIGGADSGPIDVFTAGSALDGIAIQSAWEAPGDGAELAVTLSTGGVVALGTTLWWVGDGAPTHRVFDAGRAIVGLRGVDLDVDGLSDVLSWTEDTVFLLRGRPGGGVAWGAALAASGNTVAGADAGDLTHDNLPDVAVAWVDPAGNGVLDVWEGDGLFHFTAAEPRALPGRPISLSIGDNTGEGTAQVTVLEEDDWSRFIIGAPHRFIQIGPYAPRGGEVVFPVDASLAPGGDINGDNGVELAVVGPRSPGEGRDLWFVDLSIDAIPCANTTPPTDAQCSTEYRVLEQEPAPFVAVADANGDYADDVFLANDEFGLDAIAYLPDATRIRLLDLPEYGPIGVQDFDRDGDVDLFLAGPDAWYRWYGKAFVDLERFWEPRATPYFTVRELVEAPFALLELDGDSNTVEIAAPVTDGDRTLLRVVQFTSGGGRAVQIEQIEVDTVNGGVQDMAVCGNDLYMVMGGGVYRLTTGLDFTVASQVAAPATRVACGQGPSGAQVATVEDGEIVLRLRTLGAVDRIDAVGAEDAAIGVVDGAPAMRSCATPGCTVEVWPYGDAGEAVFAIGDADGITVADDGGDRAITGRGELSVADVDGDGALDLLASDAAHRVVTIHRSIGGEIGPAELFHHDRPWSGPLWVREADGDDLPDLWSLTEDGDVEFVHSVPPEE